MRRMIKGTKITAIFLALTMLMSISTGIMAADNSNRVLLGEIVEDVGNGIILTKTFEMEQSRARYGFSGVLTGYSTHTYTSASDGRVMSRITLTAKFSSSSGQNVCYLDSGTNSIYNTGATFGTISKPMESSVSNQGLGIMARYSKYSVDYSYSNGSHNPPTAWVKCQSDAKLSDSTSTFSISTNSNDFKVNEMIISFG